MGDLVWLVGVVVVAGAAGLVWLLRRKRPADPPPALPVAPAAAADRVPDPIPATAPPAVADAPVPPVPTASRAVPEPPAPPRVVRVPSGRAAAPAPAPAAAAPRVVERPAAPPLPKVARFELRWRDRSVLVLERAAAGALAGASAVASTPVQRELLSGLLARAGELDGSSEGAPTYAVHLAADAALALARCEDSAGADAPQSLPARALDPRAAADFAAAALALQAARAHLPELRTQVGEAKAIAATLHPKLVAATEGRVKTLVQDLARYLREAEENYAGAIRKPVFIGRVEAACDQATEVCRAALAAAATARAQIEVQARAPRFGEVQLEKALAGLRELQGQRRLADASARILSGWEQLRLLLGEAAPAAPEQVDQAAAALTAGAAADAALAARLTGVIDAARPPDYVGKAEFIANRHAAREVLAGLDAEALGPAGAALARAHGALAGGYAGHGAQTLLLRVDAGGRVAEVYAPATSPAAG